MAGVGDCRTGLTFSRNRSARSRRQEDSTAEIGSNHIENFE